MAVKIKPSQIKQLLLLLGQGKNIKFIARTLGMSNELEFQDIKVKIRTK
jgi:hypothetical protein